MRTIHRVGNYIIYPEGDHDTGEFWYYEIYRCYCSPTERKELAAEQTPGGFFCECLYESEPLETATTLAAARALIRPMAQDDRFISSLERKFGVSLS